MSTCVAMTTGHGVLTMNEVCAILESWGNGAESGQMSPLWNPNSQSSR
jgi:hypothetical protein